MQLSIVQQSHLSRCIIRMLQDLFLAKAILHHQAHVVIELFTAQLLHVLLYVRHELTEHLFASKRKQGTCRTSSQTVRHTKCVHQILWLPNAVKDHGCTAEASSQMILTPT